MMFVLILVFMSTNGHGSYSQSSVVRVGGYSKYNQCVDRGNWVMAHTKIGDGVEFHCIPVDRP